MTRRILLLLTAFLMTPFASAPAGVGPENVIVVVNADSVISRTIANHYVELRQIPSTNVVMLSDVPTGIKVSLDDFKDKILKPVLTELNTRKISTQTRVIAYSADFPTSVDITPHTAKLIDDKQKQYQLPTASINGLTYLYQFVLSDSERYLDWGSNLYARGLFERHFINPFLDQSRRDRFDAAAVLMESDDFNAAADEYEKLLESSPALAPLAILAAEARAKSDDREAAIELIRQAIAAGWTSGTYLKSSESLSPLLDSPRLIRPLLFLTDLPTVAQEPVGFASNVGWSGCGHRVPSPTTDGVPYIMSCMLAVVHPRGSTVEQAIDVLERASQADRTYPEGSFWFTRTEDVRTTTRFPGFASALLWLNHLGKKAEVIHAAMPNQPGDCAGLMLGTPMMRLENKPWEFVPGAIAENLTSASAIFTSDGQTKITELLHAGAAISCGPVAEPFTIPQKFPLPIMYGYYAGGVTAIEAFYLSISSPYQTLIVGDPLVQPYAQPPADWVGVQISGAKEGDKQLRVTRNRLPVQNRQTDVGAIEIFLEGKLIRRVPQVANIEMNLSSEVSGEIELSTVLIGNAAERPRISHHEWIKLEGPFDPPIAKANGDGTGIQLRCPGADTIDLMHHSERLGTVTGESGMVRFDAKALGSGPIRFRPIARFDDRAVPGKAIVVNVPTP